MIKNQQIIRMEALDMMQLYGSTGRISDIITKTGYNRIVGLIDDATRQKFYNGDGGNSKKQIELLRDFLGWSLELIDEIKSEGK